MICNNCVMPLNKNKVCISCQNFKETKLKESDLNKLLVKNKKSNYDCLLMCSGGKDSISALYYIKEKYGLNPLVFTFDNGYEFEQAIENVKQATDILNVDWIYKKNHKFAKHLIKAIKEKQGFSLCFLCSLWYMQEVYDTLERFNINLVISGYTKGQLNEDFDENFNILKTGIKEFIDKNITNDFPKNYEDIIKRYKNSKNVNFISPHWFMDSFAEDYEKLIKEKLNWKPLKHSYPKGSTNCKLNILGSKNTIEKHGFTHFHIEMSKQILSKNLKRETALNNLDINYLNKIVPLFENVLKK